MNQEWRPAHTNCAEVELENTSQFLSCMETHMESEEKKRGKVQALQIVSIVPSVSVENNNLKNKLNNNRFLYEGQ